MFREEFAFLFGVSFDGQGALLAVLLWLCPSSPVIARSKAEKLEKLATTFSKAGNVFSSAYFLKLYLNSGLYWNERMEKLLLDVFLKIGPLSFEDLNTSVLKLYSPKSSVINFIFGSRFFAQERYSTSIKLLGSIPPSHTLAAEKFFFMGAAYGLNGKYDKAQDYYEKCRNMPNGKRGMQALIP